jgi:tryptophan-rich sensory protein
VLFFGLWLPRWALGGAVVLAVVAIVTVVASHRATRVGTWLLMLDVVWIGYLTAVNAAIVAWN